MQAIVKQSEAPGVIEISDAPVPEPGSEDVVIEIEAVSVCGADRHLYAFDEAGRNLHPRLPVILGHEGSGTVVAVGSNVETVKVGDRVALESHLVCHNCYSCRNGDAQGCQRQRILGITTDGLFAEFAGVPASACYVLPESVSFTQGALFESAGVAVHALQRANVSGSVILVTGCGPIGLTIIQAAGLMGAVEVVASEIDPVRREMASSLGATVANPEVDDVVRMCQASSPDRGGVDVAFETSGSKAAYPSLFSSVRVGGTVVTVGHPGVVSVDVPNTMNFRYLSWYGVYGRRLWGSWDLLARLVDHAGLDLTRSVTHRLPLGEFDKAMTILSEGAGKVLLQPDRKFEAAAEKVRQETRLSNA